MENSIFKMLKKMNFLKRIMSAFVIIPLMIIPIILGGYILIFTYLLLLTLIWNEIFYIIKISSKKFYSYIFFVLSVFSFIFFIILLISTETKNLFILIISIIWIFDTFSYLGGSIMKGKKIFPRISKGKTYSGLFSGLFGVTLLYILITYYFDSFSFIPYYLFLVIAALSFIGDTIVSLLKRLALIKDSGSAIPGHGGFLDRFDSFIFVFFFVGISNLLFI